MQTRTPAPVAPSNAHSRDALGPAHVEPHAVDGVGRQAPGRELLVLGLVRSGRHWQGDGERSRGGRGGISREARRAQQPLVVLEHPEVDLDEVRGRARRAEGEHGGCRRVRRTRGSPSSATTAASPATFEAASAIASGNAAARSSEVPDEFAARLGVDPVGEPHRGERLLVDLVVQRRELGEALAEHLRLCDRGAPELPVGRVPCGHLDETGRERARQRGECAAAGVRASGGRFVQGGPGR